MEIYKVGGAVRDELLAIPVTEIDWVVVGATPDKMLDLGFKLVGKDFPVFLHPHTHDEYALARTERKSGKGHKDFVCYSAPDVTLEQDLARRDLTINAIAMDEDGELIDPYHGKQDLEQHVLRHVTQAFVEDPLRVYRVARILAKLQHVGFTIAPETLSLMQEITKSGELQSLSHERIWQETFKALHTRHPAAYFQTLRDIGALSLHFPHMTHLAIKRLADISCQDRFLTPEVSFTCVSYEGEINLTVPKSFQQLQQLAHHYHADVVMLFSQSADSILATLKRTDALRRTERFMQLLDAALLINDVSDDSRRAQYQHLIDTLKAMDISDLTAQYQHQALAEKIAERQLDIISRQINGESQ